MKLTDMEKEVVRIVLEISGDKEKAAQILGIPTGTLNRRLQKYGL